MTYAGIGVAAGEAVESRIYIVMQVQCIHSFIDITTAASITITKNTQIIITNSGGDDSAVDSTSLSIFNSELATFESNVMLKSSASNAAFFDKGVSGLLCNTSNAQS